MGKTYFILLAAFAWSYGSAQIPPVPCPNYFRYVFDPYQNVEGIITIPYDGSSELQLTANASMKGFFGKENSNMQLSMVTAPSDLIQGLTPVINYKLQFPVQDSIPQITSLIFNYQQFCAGPPVPLLPIIPGIDGSTTTAVTNMYSTHTSKFATQIRSGNSVDRVDLDIN